MGALPAPPPPLHLRKARPLLTLLPRTRVWLSTLPPTVRPTALATQFARIANALCLLWEHPAECYRYFDELVASKRPHRKGFPAAVFRELNTLYAFYRSLR